ncbi:hypothetical protein GF356_07240 [candidate division GN15 bacterium]|nr:hypothetical protein [candidate division GN15 bacterium]
MSKNRLQGGQLVLVILIAALAVSTAPQATAQMPEIIVDIQDSTYFAEQDTGMMVVRLNNVEDTIAGIVLWFQLSNPEVVEFPTVVGEVYDTSYWKCLQYSGPDCIDSVEVFAHEQWDFIHVDTIFDDFTTFDTTGTLLSGWEAVWLESVGGGLYESKLVALANQPAAPYTPGIAPQQDGVLIKIPLVIKDWVEWNAHVVDVFIPKTTAGVQFADPRGNSLGLTESYVVDTTLYRCLQWVGDECLEWTVVPTPPYDSIEVVVDTVLVLDTNAVVINNGVFEVLEPLDCLPGDVNGDGLYDISDLTQLQDFIYHGSPPLAAPWNADVNGDCCISWDDLIILRDGLPIVPCECPNPVWCCCMGMRGNVDYDETDAVNIQDLTTLVEYLFSGPPLYCPEEADVAPDQSVNISDITRLVDYLFDTGEPLPACE